MKQVNYALVKKYYLEDLNDREIAEKVGCSVLSVSSWRNKQKLPTKGKRGRPRKRDSALRRYWRKQNAKRKRK